MHFNFHEKYFVDDEVDNYTNSSNKNQRNMDRTSLADSIETGLNNLGNLLSRWNYSMPQLPQFRERQTTKETDLDDQSTKEKSNEVSDDEPTKQNTQGQADKSIFFIFIYWPIKIILICFYYLFFHLYLLADKNYSHMLFLFFFICIYWPIKIFSYVFLIF